MGTPMAHRLLDAGLPLTVWNRTAARAEPFAERGAAVAGSAAQAVEGADVVVTMLADPAADLPLARAVLDRLTSHPGPADADLARIAAGDAVGQPAAGQGLR